MSLSNLQAIGRLQALPPDARLRHLAVLPGPHLRLLAAAAWSGSKKREDSAWRRFKNGAPSHGVEQ